MSLFAQIESWLSPPPSEAKVGWIYGATFAHRGLHGPGAVENSPRAFAAAIARGLAIECDIQRSADGQAMVFHDWELDRLTSVSGPVVRQSAAQLGAIRLGESGDTIPTLRQLLDQVAGRVPLLIEVKSKREMEVSAICLAVREALDGYRGHHAVMSFDARVSRWFAEQSPQTVRGLVVTEENDRGCAGTLRRNAMLWHARPDFLSYDIRDLPSKFASAQRSRGLPVVTWTVRSPELLERAAIYADAPTVEGAGVA